MMFDNSHTVELVNVTHTAQIQVVYFTTNVSVHSKLGIEIN